MEEQQAKLTEVHVRRLFKLADTPFLIRSFRECYESFGWKHQLMSGAEFGYRVRISNELSMAVDPLGDRVVAAFLPFYYWEDHIQKLHPSPQHYKQERQAYQDEFEAAAELGHRVLGSPFAHWKDADENAHQACAWAGKRALLILQQAAFDVQFGLELNFWLTPCTKQEFVPQTPLIDWLCQRSRKLHDEHGFPPLSW